MYIDLNHWSVLSTCGSDIVTGIVTTAGWKQTVQKNEPFSIVALTEV